MTLAGEGHLLFVPVHASYIDANHETSNTTSLSLAILDRFFRNCTTIQVYGQFKEIALSHSEGISST